MTLDEEVREQLEAQIRLLRAYKTNPRLERSNRHSNETAIRNLMERVAKVIEEFLDQSSSIEDFNAQVLLELAAKTIAFVEEAFEWSSGMWADTNIRQKSGYHEAEATYTLAQSELATARRLRDIDSVTERAQSALNEAQSAAESELGYATAMAFLRSSWRNRSLAFAWLLAGAAALVGFLFQAYAFINNAQSGRFPREAVEVFSSASLRLIILAATLYVVVLFFSFARAQLHRAEVERHRSSLFNLMTPLLLGARDKYERAAIYQVFLAEIARFGDSGFIVQKSSISPQNIVPAVYDKMLNGKADI